MTIYLDPPMWPRHGKVWGHMISDESIEELVEFAARAGVPERAFDRDHVDVPEDMYPHLIDMGAILVDARELIVRLRASGLRVTAAKRHGRG